MKKILTLIFCIFISFSSLCFAEKRAADSFKTQPIANSFPNIFRPMIAVFKRIFGIKPEVYSLNCYKTNVTGINLSQTEVYESCSTQSCQQMSQIIVVPQVSNPLYVDPLTYIYKVSSGKIIGEGKKVIWDLSGVKAGTYTIIAAVDDGCGFCGTMATKTITVKECPDCK